MKNLILILVFCFLSSFSFALTEGEGKGESFSTNGFIATGTFGSGTLLETTGAGTRIFWYPRKAAFRVGYIDSTQWDDANIGSYSFASGYNNTASTNYSTALGYTCVSSGTYSVAAGGFCNAANTGSVALGRSSVAYGIGSVAIGFFSKSNVAYSVALGKYNVGTTNSILEVGIGSSEGARANAMTILSDGNIGIGITNPTSSLELHPFGSVFDTASDANYRGSLVIDNNNVTFATSSVAGLEFKSSTFQDGYGWRILPAIEQTNFLRIQGRSNSKNWTDYMSFDQIGNVGIGVTNPQSKLDFGSRGTGSLMSLYGSNSYAIGVENSDLRLVTGSSANITFRRGGYATGTESMRIDGNGFVGIGKTPTVALDVNGVIQGSQFEARLDGGTPLLDFSNDNISDYDARFLLSGNDEVQLNSARLYVTDGASHSFNMYYYMDTASVASFGGGPWTEGTGILSANTIVGPSFRTYSDSRIKKNVVTSSTTVDVEKLKQIRVVDYNYINVVEQGTATKKGVIAQELEQVCPNFVSILEDQYIPNIYAMSESVEIDTTTKFATITMTNNHNLDSGDNIRIVGSDSRAYFNQIVEVIDDKKFKIILNLDMFKNENKVFVIGKKINDYRTVDYNQITMINTSVLQDLIRRVEALENK